MTTENNADIFLFKPSDLVSWTMRYKDKAVVTYCLGDTGTIFRKTKEPSKWTKPVPLDSYFTAGVHSTGSVGRWCKHDPSLEPVFIDPKGKFELYIADAQGTREHYKEFDLVIDGGNVLSSHYHKSPADILTGDVGLVEALKSFVTNKMSGKTKVLQIDWTDREAPTLDPAFWPALRAKLSGKILCNCQGGHGRSGSSLAALIMCCTDYSPLDAITHVRTVHCARAIESSAQHEYLNKVGIFLGRPGNALEAKKVKDFQERFLTEVTSSFAKPYQQRLTQTKES